MNLIDTADAYGPVDAEQLIRRALHPYPDDLVIATAAARAHRATPAQFALAWQLHRGPHVLPIPGTSSVEHVRENVAATDITLSATKFAAMTELVFSEGNN